MWILVHVGWNLVGAGLGPYRKYCFIQVGLHKYVGSTKMTEIHLNWLISVQLSGICGHISLPNEQTDKLTTNKLKAVAKSRTFPICGVQKQKDVWPFMAMCINFCSKNYRRKWWSTMKSEAFWPYSWQNIGEKWPSPIKSDGFPTNLKPSKAVAGVAQSFGLGGSGGISTAGWEQPYAGAGWAEVPDKVRGNIRKSQGKSPKVRGILMPNQHGPWKGGSWGLEALGSIDWPVDMQQDRPVFSSFRCKEMGHPRPVKKNVGDVTYLRHVWTLFVDLILWTPKVVLPCKWRWQYFEILLVHALKVLCGVCPTVLHTSNHC